MRYHTRHEWIIWWGQVAIENTWIQQLNFYAPRLASSEEVNLVLFIRSSQRETKCRCVIEVAWSFWSAIPYYRWIKLNCSFSLVSERSSVVTARDLNEWEDRKPANSIAMTRYGKENEKATKKTDWDRPSETQSTDNHEKKGGKDTNEMAFSCWQRQNVSCVS